MTAQKIVLFACGLLLVSTFLVTGDDDLSLEEMERISKKRIRQREEKEQEKKKTEKEKKRLREEKKIFGLFLIRREKELFRENSGQLRTYLRRNKLKEAAHEFAFLGRHAKAFESMERFVRRNPDDKYVALGDAYIFLADCCHKVNQADKAEALLKKGEELNPLSAQRMRNRWKWTDSRRAKLEKLLEKDTLDYKEYLRVMDLFRDIGDSFKSRITGEFLLKYRKEDVIDQNKTFFIAYCDILRRCRSGKYGLDIVESLKRRHADWAFFTEGYGDIQRAYFNENIGNRREAVRICNTVIAAFPKNPDVRSGNILVYKGEVLRRSGEYRDAIQVYKIVMKKYPGHRICRNGRIKELIEECKNQLMRR